MHLLTFKGPMFPRSPYDSGDCICAPHCWLIIVSVQVSSAIDVVWPGHYYPHPFINPGLVWVVCGSVLVCDDLSLLTDRCETEVCRWLTNDPYISGSSSLYHSYCSLIVLLVFVGSNYKSDGFKALLWLIVAECSLAGGEDKFLSISGKYSALCHFLTGKGDLLSYFPQPGWWTRRPGSIWFIYTRVCFLNREGNKFSCVYFVCTYKYLVVQNGGRTCCLSWCMSRSFSLFRAITSSWAFLRLEDDSSSSAMFASFSLMAASSVCCLTKQQKGNKWQVNQVGI